MSGFSTLFAVVGIVVIGSAITPAWGDTATENAPTSTTPELKVATTSRACDGASVSDALRLAREARQNGDHQRAAECFLIAGDNPRAHREMIRATGDSIAAQKRTAAANVETVRSQARRMREAFR